MGKCVEGGSGYTFQCSDKLLHSEENDMKDMRVDSIISIRGMYAGQNVKSAAPQRFPIFSQFDSKTSNDPRKKKYSSWPSLLLSGGIGHQQGLTI